MNDNTQLQIDVTTALGLLPYGARKMVAKRCGLKIQLFDYHVSKGKNKEKLELILKKTKELSEELKVKAETNNQKIQSL